MIDSKSILDHNISRNKKLQAAAESYKLKQNERDAKTIYAEILEGVKYYGSRYQNIDREDIISTTVENVFTKFHQYDSSKSLLKTWIWSIVHNNIKLTFRNPTNTFTFAESGDQMFTPGYAIVRSQEFPEYEYFGDAGVMTYEEILDAAQEFDNENPTYGVVTMLMNRDAMDDIIKTHEGYTKTNVKTRIYRARRLFYVFLTERFPNKTMPVMSIVEKFEKKK